MAFFGLTQIGYQDTIREHVRDPKMNPVAAFRSGAYRHDSNFHLPPLEKCEKPLAEAKQHAYDMNQTAGYGQGVCNSAAELCRFKRKHIRDPRENYDIYRRPLTTSGEIGVWRKDEPLREREPWTYVKRHVHLNSEMTRFVNEMALTNRDFSLF